MHDFFFSKNIDPISKPTSLEEVVPPHTHVQQKTLLEFSIPERIPSVSTIMKCFVINLERAVERRETCQTLFAAAPALKMILVEAVDGQTLELPHPHYSDRGYRLCHGKTTNVNQVACYLSHLKAMRMFLETDEEHAVIMEDDVEFGPDLPELINLALKARPNIGCLRLAGRRQSKPIIKDQLNAQFQLGIDLTRQTGTGCYLLNRETAHHMLEKLPPMFLPIDHAFDRDWRWPGLTMRFIPFPAGQLGNPGTSFNADRKNDKLPFRYFTVFPFRAYNETRRFLHRLGKVLTTKKSF
ncbi:MAG: glycosyltransferase family 25 protein [Verrucomicrobiota bacterium]